MPKGKVISLIEAAIYRGLKAVIPGIHQPEHKEVRRMGVPFVMRLKMKVCIRSPLRCASKPFFISLYQHFKKTPERNLIMKVRIDPIQKTAEVYSYRDRWGKRFAYSKDGKPNKQIKEELNTLFNGWLQHLRREGCVLE